MNNLYDLVTRIDALTANSQQVLNALIRSCIAGGTSNGYTITKYDVPLTLKREDIYRLYDFYRTWEASGFTKDEAEFGALLESADARWREGTGDDSTHATDAVVIHSKMLYMSNSDKDRTEPDYWVAKIRESASGKATISSAPIPLNLRTPLYDENLSVKSFSQFETYLFPMGYHRMEILGTAGNGEDYFAGGRNWTIDASDILTLRGNHTVFGTVTNPGNRLDNYGTSVNTLSGGLESYAMGDNSLAYGNRSVTVGVTSTVFGERNEGYGNRTFVAGGTENVALGMNSLAFGSYSSALGHNTMAGNYYTVAGAWPYRFTFATGAAQAESTECDITYLESIGCVQEVVEEYPATQIIRVSAAEVATFMSDFDVAEGDDVALFGLRYKDSNGVTVHPTDQDGYAFNPFYVTVTYVKILDNGDYEIGLAKPIPAPKNGGHYVPVSGKVTVVRKALPVQDNPRMLYTHQVGYRSTALGSCTEARGMAQTVVGSMNVPDYYSRFVVGVGSTSYISDEWYDEPYRANGLLISPKYSYMKLDDGASIVGVVKNKSADIDAPYNNAPLGTRPDGAFLFNSNGNSRSFVSASDKGTLALSASGASIVSKIGTSTGSNPIYGGGDDVRRPVTTVLRSLQGTAVIGSGSYIRGTEESDIIDSLLAISNVIRPMNDASDDPDIADHAVALYAEDGIEIRNTSTETGINIESCHYITVTGKGLILNGMMFGTMPATDKSYSYTLKRNASYETNLGRLDDIDYANTTGHSGFYYLPKGSTTSHLYTPWDSTYASGIDFHIYNSGVEVSDGSYRISSLAIPGECVNSSGFTRRPVVVAGTIDEIGDTDMTPDKVYSKELAYIDDVAPFSTGPMACGGYLNRTATTTAQSMPGAISGGYFPWLIEGASDENKCYARVEYTDDGIDYTQKLALYYDDTLKFCVDGICYTINGNMLSISGNIYAAATSGDIRPFDVQFAFRLGCLPDTSGISYYPLSQQDECVITGHVYRVCNHHTSTFNLIMADARILPDGIVIVHIQSPNGDHGGGKVEDIMSTDPSDGLHFTVSGPTNFYPRYDMTGAFPGFKTSKGTQWQARMNVPGVITRSYGDLKALMR